jgi:hypothetical protein
MTPQSGAVISKSTETQVQQNLNNGEGATFGEIVMQKLKFQTLLKIAMLASAAQIVVPAHAEKMQLAPVHHADGCPRLGSANAEPGSCPVP